MTERDVIFLPLTDSMELYGSRVVEQRELHGPFGEVDAAATYAQYLLGAETDHVRELTYQDRKQLHNFKYFTWVEQQKKNADDLRAMWTQEFWDEMFGQVDEWDRLIRDFNARIGS